MKSLTSFGKVELECIMNKLGAVSRIFNSEAQFQFELAWNIKEEFDCEIRLEELSCIITNEKNNRNKKYYTDIILEKGDLRIALELKYKTALYEDRPNNIYLKAHGASDLGAYDFMWDVHRLQVLTGIETDNSCDIKRPCSRAYAIILTNDAYYWNDTQPRETINREFLIGGDKIGNGVLTKGSHKWYTTEGEVGLSTALLNMASRQQDIILSQDYCYKWMTYNAPPIFANKHEHNKFKYMVIEVINNANCALEISKEGHYKDLLQKFIYEKIAHTYLFEVEREWEQDIVDKHVFYIDIRKMKNATELNQLLADNKNSKRVCIDHLEILSKGARGIGIKANINHDLAQVIYNLLDTKQVFCNGLDIDLGNVSMLLIQHKTARKPFFDFKDYAAKKYAIM